MSMRGYRSATIALAALVVILALIATRYFLESVRLQAAEVDAARTVRSFYALQELAGNHDLKEAVIDLQGVIELKPKYYEQNSGHAFIIDRCRAEAITNIISILRVKSGEDFGNDPSVWIQRYKAK